jgi:hypothetical protein
MKNIPWKKLVAQGILKNPFKMDELELHRHSKKIFALRNELLIQGDWNQLDMDILAFISATAMKAIGYEGRPVPESFHAEVRAWRKSK